jgi:seryl-tRNA synthetase
MVDIEEVRKTPRAYKEAAKQKGFAVDIDKLLKVDAQRRTILQALEAIRAKKNELTKTIGSLSKDKRTTALSELKKLDPKDDALRPKLRKLETEWTTLLSRVPNPPAKDVPAGKDERDNKAVKTWGKPDKFQFKERDHVDLGQRLDLIDIERGVKVAGSRSYFLKNEAVLLEFGLIQFVFDMLSQEGFQLAWAPALAKREVMYSGGYLEHGTDVEIYHLLKDDLFLIGTSEQAMVGYHAAEILDEKSLPERYAIFSPCFRREAGSYGKDVRGIFRVHQFDKVEMFSYTKGDVADSDKEHHYFLSLEEKIMQALKIPYRVVKMCTGDLGLAFSRKYDIDAWMPGRGDWGEVTSTSTATDFQARRAQTRYRDKTGKTHFVHTVNGTAVAIPRMLIAIMENYQQKDGSVKVPAVLQKYVPFKEIKPKV